MKKMTRKTISKFFPQKTLLALALGLGAASSYAAPCSTTSPRSYVLNLTNTGTEAPAAGTVIEQTATDGGASYTASCACTGLYKESLITVQPLLTEDVGRGSTAVDATGKAATYYVVNDNLSIAAQVQVGGKKQNQYFSAPFEKLSNGGATTGAPQRCKTANTYTSGGAAKLFLMVTKPFVGSQQETVKFADIYINSKATTGADDGGALGSPVASITVNINVQINATCDFEALTKPIVVDFGDILASDIMTQGTGPASAEKQTSINITCTGIDPNKAVTVTVQGTASSDPNFLKTDNPDVGIKFADTAGTLVKPNNTDAYTLTDVTVDPKAFEQTGRLTVVNRPVNVTGKTPATGAFTATATLNAQVN